MFGISGSMLHRDWPTDLAVGSCTSVIGSDDPKVSTAGLLPRADETSSHDYYDQKMQKAVAKSKPQEWVDRIHEEDGGDDEIGPRPQNGQALLRDALKGMVDKNGWSDAWDDVTNKKLDPDLVKQARITEME